MILEMMPLSKKVGFAFVYNHEFRMEYMASNSAKVLCELINVYNTMCVVYLVYFSSHDLILCATLIWLDLVMYLH